MHISTISAVTAHATNTAALAPTAAPAPAEATTSTTGHQAVEALRAELAQPLQFLANGGCPWKGGKP